MLVSFFFVKPEKNLALILFGFIALLLILQTVWLLPALNARAAEVISKSFADSSKTHFIYIAFEVLKFISLFALGAELAKSYLKFD